jgi:toxin ParE1/3/4
LINIVEWSRRRFGPEQARRYRAIVLATARELENGPVQPGTRDWGHIAPDLRAIHVARHSRQGRHYVVYRVSPDDAGVIDIVRILHDAMDFARHLAPGDSDNPA